jgi:hypothetical protein
MNNSLRLAGLALALGAAGAAQAAADVASSTVAVTASAPAAAVIDEPAARDPIRECESAVGSAIREQRGKQLQGLQFEGDARSAKSDSGQIDVKGSGRYRGANAAPVTFRYSCLVNEATGTASGVVFHETDSTPPPALPVWQADLSRISAESCESAAASALQSNNPRASSIVFDSGSRKLEPGQGGGTAMVGSGHVVRAPGLQPSAFRYRCEFDASGKVASARASD